MEVSKPTSSTLSDGSAQTLARDDERRKLGELVIVVLRARHLTNVKLSKQDPYCTLTVSSEKRRTSVIKKGGQHPAWDEQLKFEIFEDTEDILVQSKSDTESGTEGAKVPPGKRKRKVFEKGSKIVKLCCYADAPREPELIGEAEFDLAKVLNSGEDEEWITINRKDRYAGEIFLEFTYFISGTPPPPKPPKLPNTGYGSLNRPDAHGQPAYLRHASSATNLHGMSNGTPLGPDEDSRRRAGSFMSNTSAMPPAQAPLNPQFQHSASMHSFSQLPPRANSLDMIARPASMMSLASVASATSTIGSRPLPSTMDAHQSRVDRLPPGFVPDTSTWNQPPQQQTPHYGQPIPVSQSLGYLSTLQPQTLLTPGLPSHANSIPYHHNSSLPPSSSTTMLPSSSYTQFPQPQEYAPYAPPTPLPTAPPQDYGAPSYASYQSSQLSQPPPLPHLSYSDPQRYLAHPPPPPPSLPVSQTPIPQATLTNSYHSSSDMSTVSGTDGLSFASSLVPHRRSDGPDTGRPLPEPTYQRRLSIGSYQSPPTSSPMMGGHGYSSVAPPSMGTGQYGYAPSQIGYQDPLSQQYQHNSHHRNVYETPVGNSSPAPSSSYYQSPYPPSAPTPAPASAPIHLPPPPPPPPPSSSTDIYRHASPISPSYNVSSQYQHPSTGSYTSSQPSGYLNQPTPSQEIYSHSTSPNLNQTYNGAPPPPPPPPRQTPSPANLQTTWLYGAGQVQQPTSYAASSTGASAPGGYSGSWQSQQPPHWT
ncbi:C2 domain [Phaffia rhodozyma]|uniref:C2 domain n=1 Tax=Phaffia rhodozyma TaxID=264483 RepID=A0A0F7SGW5_PHARH|nr:C2 domain [Phaffia rhodozyma]